MAIFERETKESGAKEYLALLDKTGDMIAFISPVKGVSNELLVEALQAKDLNVEIRESKADKVEISL